jgi:transposase InsO family protein
VEDADIDLRDEIQRIALEWPCYGWRHDGGVAAAWVGDEPQTGAADHAGRQPAVPATVVTTDSGHSRKVYPNLAEPMALTGINQLWVADITYIRLEMEFVYLAVAITCQSRRSAWTSVLPTQLSGLSAASVPG